MYMYDKRQIYVKEHFVLICKVASACSQELATSLDVVSSRCPMCYVATTNLI